MPNHPGADFGTRGHPSRVSRGEENGVLRNHPRLSFDPRNLGAPLLLWTRADMGIGFNGSTISGWDDISGNGRDFAQSTASKQPSLRSGQGGRVSIKWDGSDDMAGVDLYASLTDKDDWTIVVVGGGWTWGDSADPWYTRGMLGAPSGGASYFEVSVTNEAGGGLVMAYWDATGSAHRSAYGDDSQAEGDPFILVGISNGTAFQLAVNGTLGSAVTTVSGLASGATTLEVGRGNGNLNSWDGSISEMLIFDGALSTEDREGLEVYLSDRYSISRS